MSKERFRGEDKIAKDAEAFEKMNMTIQEREAKYGLDQREDPLQTFRETPQEELPLGGSYNNEIGEVLISEDQVPDKVLFEETLQEYELGDEVEDFLEGDEEEPQWHKDYQAVASTTGEAKEKKPLSNSLGEFFLMEECSKFMAKTYLPEKFKQQRPMFLKLKDGSGIEMTDQRVLEHVQAFNDCKRNNKWHLYKKDEIDFMKRCAAWNHYYQRMLKKSKNRPTMDDGTPLSDEDIKDLALQYNQLRVKKPEEFAELKYEKHEWAKGNLQWIPGYYKDQKQWTAFVPNKSGKEVKLVTYSTPAKMSGEFYYVVDGEHKDPATGFLTQFVNVRYPTEKNLHDTRKEQQETAKEEKKVA